MTFSYINDSKKKARGSNLAKTFTLSDLESKESMEKIFFKNRDRNNALLDEYRGMPREDKQINVDREVPHSRFKRNKTKGMMR